MVLRFAVESVSFNRKQAVEMGKLTSPDPPNPRAISSRIKCSTSPYQVEQWKPYTRSIEKISYHRSFYLDKKKGSASTSKEMISNYIQKILIGCLLSVKAL